MPMIVPDSYVVTSTADDGSAGTLSAAITFRRNPRTGARLSCRAHAHRGPEPHVRAVLRRDPPPRDDAGHRPQPVRRGYAGVAGSEPERLILISAKLPASVSGNNVCGGNATRALALRLRSHGIFASIESLLWPATHPARLARSALPSSWPGLCPGHPRLVVVFPAPDTPPEIRFTSWSRKDVDGRVKGTAMTKAYQRVCMGLSR